jgi:TolB-like protein
MLRPKKNNMRTIILLSVIVILTAGVSGCATNKTASKKSGFMTVAVFDIENLSPEDSTGEDLGLLLSSEIVGRLSIKPGVQIIERQKLVSVLQELQLGSSDLADESVRLKVGRMLGAKRMVFGSYLVSGLNMRLDLRLVDVETGKILKTAKETVIAGETEEWMDAAGEAADKLM